MWKTGSRSYYTVQCQSVSGNISRLYYSIENTTNLFPLKKKSLLFPFQPLQHVFSRCCVLRASSTNSTLTSTIEPPDTSLRKGSTTSTTGLMTEHGIHQDVSLVVSFELFICREKQGRRKIKCVCHFPQVRLFLMWKKFQK